MPTDRNLVRPTRRPHLPGRRRRTVFARQALLATALFLTLTSLRIAAFPYPIVLTQVPLSVQSPAISEPTLLRADLFAQARLVLLSPDGAVRPLSEGFVSACDPDVSFDGKRVLFAGRRAEEPNWAIWEMNLAEGSPRRVTPPGFDARQPRFLSSLFTLDSPEPWYTIVYVRPTSPHGERHPNVATSLYSIRLDGSENWRITFNPNAEFDPFQMADGRLIFSGWRRAAWPRPQPDRIALFGLNIDGTELEFYGGEQGPLIQHMGCAFPDGLVVFVEPEPGSWDGAGQLGSIHARRPHQSYQPLPRSTTHQFLYPTAGDPGHLLVSRRTAGGNANADLVSYELTTGTITPLFDSPDHHDLQAAVVRPRPEPDGRSTMVNPKRNDGVLYALNCYDADPGMQPHLQPGTLQRLRILEGVPPGETPDAAAGGSHAQEWSLRIVGEIPVESDGSFHVEVPADAPLRLQALDQDGVALATCGWIWVKPRETRGCIGCHEDPELVPENQFVESLRRPAIDLVLPVETRRTLGFHEDIFPILERHCATANCHLGNNTPLNLAATEPEAESERGRHAYAALLGLVGSVSPGHLLAAQRPRYVQPARARASHLVWQLLGKDTSRPWDPPAVAPGMTPLKVSQMPPAPHAPALAEREIKAIVQWIDLGAPWNAAGNPAPSLPSTDLIPTP